MSSIGRRILPFAQALRRLHTIPGTNPPVIKGNDLPAIKKAVHNVLSTSQIWVKLSAAERVERYAAAIASYPKQEDAIHLAMRNLYKENNFPENAPSGPRIEASIDYLETLRVLELYKAAFAHGQGVLEATNTDFPFDFGGLPVKPSVDGIIAPWNFGAIPQMMGMRAVASGAGTILFASDLTFPYAEIFQNALHSGDLAKLTTIIHSTSPSMFRDAACTVAEMQQGLGLSPRLWFTGHGDAGKSVSDKVSLHLNRVGELPTESPVIGEGHSLRGNPIIIDEGLTEEDALKVMSKALKSAEEYQGHKCSCTQPIIFTAPDSLESALTATKSLKKEYEDIVFPQVLPLSQYKIQFLQDLLSNGAELLMGDPDNINPSEPPLIVIKVTGALADRVLNEAPEYFAPVCFIVDKTEATETPIEDYVTNLPASLTGGLVMSPESLVTTVKKLMAEGANISNLYIGTPGDEGVRTAGSEESTGFGGQQGEDGNLVSLGISGWDSRAMSTATFYDSRTMENQHAAYLDGTLTLPENLPSLESIFPPQFIATLEKADTRLNAQLWLDAAKRASNYRHVTELEFRKTIAIEVATPAKTPPQITLYIPESGELSLDNLINFVMAAHIAKSLNKTPQLSIVNEVSTMPEYIQEFLSKNLDIPFTTESAITFSKNLETSQKTKRILAFGEPSKESHLILTKQQFSLNHFGPTITSFLSRMSVCCEGPEALQALVDAGILSKTEVKDLG